MYVCVLPLVHVIKRLIKQNTNQPIRKKNDNMAPSRAVYRMTILEQNTVRTTQPALYCV